MKKISTDVIYEHLHFSAQSYELENESFYLLSQAGKLFRAVFSFLTDYSFPC